MAVSDRLNVKRLLPGILLILLVVVLTGCGNSSYGNQDLSFSYPNQCSLCASDGEYWIGESSNGGIPYVVIQKYLNCSDENQFMNEYKSALAAMFPDATATEGDVKKLRDADWLHMAFTYTHDGGKILEDRYARAYGSNCWVICRRMKEAYPSSTDKIFKAVSGSLEITESGSGDGFYSVSDMVSCYCAFMDDDTYEPQQASVPGMATLSEPGNTAGLNVTRNPASQVTLQTVSNDVFSMQIPAGWETSLVGDLIHYGIRAYDPNDPRYQIFVYLKMEPCMKSSAACDVMTGLGALANDPEYLMFGAAPALSEISTKGFYDKFEQMKVFAQGPYGGRIYSNAAGHVFPQLTCFEVIDAYDAIGSLAGYGVGEQILRANFISYLDNGTVDNAYKGQGLFYASVMDLGPHYAEGEDVMPLLVYNVMGFSAAEEDLIAWEPILNQCIGSLRYTDAFVRATQQNSINQAEAAMDANATVQAAYDAYNNAWSNRQTAYDISSQKTSDSTLGYDRLVDTVTGETYQAEVGWYDQYDLHRESYGNVNLQPAADADYLKPVYGTIYY